MNIQSRFVRVLLLAVFSSQFLAVGSLAQGPASPTKPQQQEPSAQPTAQSPAETYKSKQDWPGQTFTYSLFFIEVGNGPSTPEMVGRCRFSNTDWSKILGIREDEERAMCTLVTEAQDQINETSEQYRAAKNEANTNRSPELAAKRDALSLKRRMILDDAITRLSEELGVEDFKKLDDYLRITLRSGPTVVAQPHAAGSLGQRPAANGSKAEVSPAAPNDLAGTCNFDFSGPGFGS